MEYYRAASSLYEGHAFYPAALSTACPGLEIEVLSSEQYRE
jgi:hypothetical protein